MLLRNILRTVRPFLGKLDVEIDRNRQLIYFTKAGKTEILTVNQLFDEIESIFSKTTRAPAPESQVTLDPFGGGGIDRIEAPWLSNCNKPVANPLSMAQRADKAPGSSQAGR